MPFARPYLRRPDPGVLARHASVSYTPPQLAGIYGFPEGDGAGQTIAFIELGGGFVRADFSAYMTALSLPVPRVDVVLVDGAGNTPDGASGADGEVMLDVEAAMAVAPGAAGKMIFAPNTDGGFADAIKAAVQAGATVISISWGAPEDAWSASAIKAMEGALQACVDAGVTVLAACGDGGSGDGEQGVHCDYPSSSPHVIGCGGTTLLATGGSIQSESVWNSGGGATGGGVSALFQRPAWQSGIQFTGKGRGVPDVAAVADPNTGYVVRVDGKTLVFGGTSAVAPLWAGLVARMNSRLGSNLGFFNSKLYGAAAAFRDITAGNNGTYMARAGWDACTGLGTPDGAKLLAALQPTAPPPPPPPPPPAAFSIPASGTYLLETTTGGLTKLTFNKAPQ
jgi:kumamolisin